MRGEGEGGAAGSPLPSAVPSRAPDLRRPRRAISRQSPVNLPLRDMLHIDRYAHAHAWPHAPPRSRVHVHVHVTCTACTSLSLHSYPHAAARLPAPPLPYWAPPSFRGHRPPPSPPSHEEGRYR